MLRRCAGGFGAVALAALLADGRTVATSGRLGRPGDADRRPHHRPRARSVIFLFMEGGPSQVDTFDPKPRLDREDGQPFKMKAEPTQFNNNGKTLASPWKFRPGGTCGTPVSDLFPHVRLRMDDIAVIRSMTSAFSEHAAANYFLHTGTGQQGRPSMGSWVSYGLGSECHDLPGFVVLNSGKMPIGGPDSFNSGFLPATYQGSVFRAGADPVAYIKPLEPAPRVQRSKFAAMRELDREVTARFAHADALESAVANYEMAFRMQSAVPEFLDLAGESAATRSLYGLDSPDAMTSRFAESCLKARRLVERGVRFVELTMPVYPGDPDSWDAHGNLKKNHEANARAVDQPIAALLVRPEGPRITGDDAGGLRRRVRTDAVRAGGRRTRPQSVRIQRLAGRWGRQGRDDLRGHGRVRLQGGRGPVPDPRPARDDAPPAGRGSQAADLPLGRPRHAADRRPRRADRGDPGVIEG